MSDQSTMPSQVTDPSGDALSQRLAAQRARQTERPSADPTGGDGGRTRPSVLAGSTWQRWMRFLHVYTSMVAFVVIGFFGITGLLLNHPAWLGGDELITTLSEGTLPATVMDDAGDVEFLAVSEFLRSEEGVVGEVTNFDQVGNEGSINYTGPAYGASARFDVVTLDYTLRVTEENFVNAMRDLHTGSDTNAAWNWLIDISAGFLVFVAVTGVGIQTFLRKRRRKAFGWLVVGTVISIAVAWLTLV